MSDSQLRELERRWRETGSVEDEARYLLERVRVGDLEQEKLELAAYCGYRGALGAMGTRIEPEVSLDGLIAQASRLPMALFALGFGVVSAYAARSEVRESQVTTVLRRCLAWLSAPTLDLASKAYRTPLNHWSSNSAQAAYELRRAIRLVPDPELRKVHVSKVRAALQICVADLGEPIVLRTGKDFLVKWILNPELPSCTDV